MNPKTSCIATIAFAMLIASCGRNKVSPPSVGASQEENGIITVSAPTQINTFKTNDTVTIVVQNNSEDEIAFQPGGVALSIKQGNTWVDIENTMIGSIGRERILSPKSYTEDSIMTVPIAPAIDGKESALIRITITGMDQTTNQKVQGFVEVTLSTQPN